MNVLADIAVAAARHAQRTLRQPEQRRGIVTGLSGTDAVVAITGYPTTITVPNVALAAAGDSVLVAFPSLGVAYVAAWL